MSVLQLYADRCVRVSPDGYHWSESGLEGDPAALRSAVGVPRDRYVGDHIYYWIDAGLLSILESGQNRGLDLTSPEGQRTEWPGGDVTGEDTALGYDPDEAFGLFFPAEEGNSELERPVDQRPRIAPAQRFQRHRSPPGSTRYAPSCLRNITAVVLVGGAIADELHAAGEATQALEALLTVALGCWWGNRDQTTRNRVVAVANRLAPPDEPALLSVLALADPVNRGRGVLERLRQAVAPDSGNPLAMFHLAKARAFGRTTWPSRFSRRPSTASAPTGTTRARREGARVPGVCGGARAGRAGRDTRRGRGRTLIGGDRAAALGCFREARAGDHGGRARRRRLGRGADGGCRARACADGCDPIVSSPWRLG